MSTSYQSTTAGATAIVRVNRDAVQAALAVIVPAGQVFEVRALNATTTTDRFPRTLTGYFDDPARAAAAVATIRSADGVYYTPNPINSALLSRAANRLRVAGKGTSTADHDVTARRWLLVDADPVRPSGISATEAEHAAALDRADRIAMDLANEGFPLPIVADSGNGGHLMFCIDLPATDGGLVAAVLAGLARRYDDAAVHVDTTVYNAARIWKLPGTVAAKGDHTPDRPHRLARIISVPTELEVVTADQLRSLTIAPAATPVVPQQTRGPAGRAFDLAAWIASHGLDVTGPTDWPHRGGVGRRWVFGVCPWNADHTDGSAWVGQMASGALAAGCHHAGCAGHGWAELRAIFEPRLGGATQSGTRGPRADHRSDVTAGTPIPGPVLLNMADVTPRAVAWLWDNRFPVGRLSLLVGVPGAGKSYLTCDMAARVSTGTPWPDGAPCDRGHVLLITAEDDPADTIRPRLDACGAEPARVTCLTGVHFADPDTGDTRERTFSLADVGSLESALTKLPECRLVIVDPIGSFLGGGVDSHRDNEVRAVLAPLAALAERHAVAVVVVCHRRKGNAGSADETAMGSRAFTGIARVAWHLTRDPDDTGRRLLLNGKNNLAPECHGLAFTIAGQPVGAIVWEREPVAMSADDAMTAERRAGDGDNHEVDDAQTKLEQAQLFVADALRAGPRAWEQVSKAGRQAGHSPRTLERARTRVANTFKAGGGKWYWRNKDDARTEPVAESVATGDTNGGLGEVGELPFVAAYPGADVKPLAHAAVGSGL